MQCVLFFFFSKWQIAAYFPPHRALHRNTNFFDLPISLDGWLAAQQRARTTGSFFFISFNSDVGALQFLYTRIDWVYTASNRYRVGSSYVWKTYMYVAYRFGEGFFLNQRSTSGCVLVSEWVDRTQSFGSNGSRVISGRIDWILCCAIYLEPSTFIGHKHIFFKLNLYHLFLMQNN